MRKKWTYLGFNPRIGIVVQIHPAHPVHPLCMAFDFWKVRRRIIIRMQSGAQWKRFRWAPGMEFVCPQLACFEGNELTETDVEDMLLRLRECITFLQVGCTLDFVFISMPRPEDTIVVKKLNTE